MGIQARQCARFSKEPWLALTPRHSRHQRSGDSGAGIRQHLATFKESYFLRECHLFKDRGDSRIVERQRHRAIHRANPPGNRDDRRHHCRQLLAHFIATPLQSVAPALSGSHRIEVTVNNSDSIPLAIRNNSHACTESTQTNWNGLIGEIHLEARNPLHIASAKVFPKTARGGYKIAAKLSQPADAPFTLRAEADEAEPIIVDIPKGATTCDFLLPLPFGVEKWSEWSPRLDNIRLSLVSQSKCVIDNYDISCGYRSFTASGSHFAVNGDPVFLRGRHDACVFRSRPTPRWIWTTGENISAHSSNMASIM